MSSRCGSPTRRVPLTRPTFGEEEVRLLSEVVRSGWVTQGPRVEEFEARFAEALEAGCAVAVSSGTAALFLSLRALGVGPGDEVIVPSLTFIASVNSIVHAGAEPILVDVDPNTYNLDPERVLAAISERTRAVMVVHQLGFPADLAALQKLADRHGLALIEDSACAVGSRYRGCPIGASGNPGCFSFHPRKVLVTGEGGMVTCGDPTLASRLRRLRHQGMSVSDLERHRSSSVIVEEYTEVGYNFRLSDLHAALGIAQLARLDTLVSRRRELAARYDAAFAGHDTIETPSVLAETEPNYQSYIVRLRGFGRARRNAVLDAMQERGVATRRGLMAVHLESAYRASRLVAPLPHSEEADAQTLVLPIYGELSDDDQDYVIEQLEAVLAEARG